MVYTCTELRDLGLFHESCIKSFGLIENFKELNSLLFKKIKINKFFVQFCKKH